MLCLPPHPGSVSQAIKRVHLHQLLAWLQCTSQSNICLLSQNNGWKSSEEKKLRFLYNTRNVKITFSLRKQPLKESDRDAECFSDKESTKITI